MGADKVTRIDNTRTWLELEALKLGSHSQNERWRADLLPEDELLALARIELFKPFDGFERWDKKHWVMSQHVRHEADCDVRDVVYFETCNAGELAQDQYETFALLKHAVDDALKHPWCVNAQLGWNVVARSHWATCRACEGEAVRYSAVVTVSWAGRTLSREYLL